VLNAGVCVLQAAVGLPLQPQSPLLLLLSWGAAWHGLKVECVGLSQQRGKMQLITCVSA
jgi:hypothetical protein